jgi:hypothetical protein
MPRKRIFEPAVAPYFQGFTHFASSFWRNSTIWIQRIGVGLPRFDPVACRKQLLDQGSRPPGRDESLENRVGKSDATQNLTATPPVMRL